MKTNAVRRGNRAGASKRALIGLLALLAGCDFAPEYHRPAVGEIPAEFKEAPGWRPAAPAPSDAGAAMWALFGDADLDDLEADAFTENQNVATAAAAYRAALAVVGEERALYYPTVGITTGASMSGRFSNKPINGGTSLGNGNNSSGNGSNAFNGNSNIPNGSQTETKPLDLGATWAPDFSGGVRDSVAQARALAQANAADLANATLTAQSTLALDYVAYRGVLAQQAVYVDTAAAYAKALEITTHLYDAGSVSKSDVFQAETSLRNARATVADLQRQADVLEHAIAVLVGANPTTFSIAPADWNTTVPDVPAILPGALLERRPDVAGAERRVAAANAAIGIARSAYFPTIDFTADAATDIEKISSILTGKYSAWSLGVDGAMTLLDFGARASKVDESRATYEQTVAQYRQTVLTAFQQTEDELAAIRDYASEATETAAAADAAQHAEAIARNQYLAGKISYTAVIVAQTQALSARIAAVQAIVNRQTAAVLLMEAIGGSWADGANVVSR
jgi:NodT family efflux transporter outer membrane factor (OMF) lipoprotein